MFMRKAQRVPRLVAYHAVIFRFRRAHAELFQVHGLPVLGDVEDIRAQVGPVAAVFATLTCDANLRVGLGLHEFTFAGAPQAFIC